MSLVFASEDPIHYGGKRTLQKWGSSTKASFLTSELDVFCHQDYLKVLHFVLLCITQTYVLRESKCVQLIYSMEDFLISFPYETHYNAISNWMPKRNIL